MTIQKGIIIFLLCALKMSIEAQDLDALKAADYSNQQKLLIKSEIRKILGDQANSKEVRELTTSLIPWAMMEEIEPPEFAKYIYLFTRANEAGISFTVIEDLIPVLSKFKGEETDFLLLSLSMLEAEEAALPLFLRDKYLSGVILKKWDGLSILTGMRILILSRVERKNSEEMIDSIYKKLPKNLRNLGSRNLQKSFFDLTSDFQNTIGEKIYKKMESDLVQIRSLEKGNLSRYVQVSKRNLKQDFLTIENLEMKERPRLEWTPEEIEGPNLSGPSQTSDWRTVSMRILMETVNSWIGTRYVYGASSKSGTDCSGFTRSVLTDQSIAVPNQMVPRSARDQAKIGISAVRNQLRAGDLVFFSASPNQSKITHVGLSLGADRFVHASSSKGVIIQSLDEKWWNGRYTGARRIFNHVGK